jgi:hypothetical protein
MSTSLGSWFTLVELQLSRCHALNHYSLRFSAELIRAESRALEREKIRSAGNPLLKKLQSQLPKRGITKAQGSSNKPFVAPRALREPRPTPAAADSAVVWTAARSDLDQQRLSDSFHHASSVQQNSRPTVPTELKTSPFPRTNTAPELDPCETERPSKRVKYEIFEADDELF